MKEIIIQCPNCKTEIPVSEVLGSQIRAQLEADLQNEHQQQQLQQEIAAAETRTRHGAAMERAGEADRTRRNQHSWHVWRDEWYPRCHLAGDSSTGTGCRAAGE